MSVTAQVLGVTMWISSANTGCPHCPSYSSNFSTSQAQQCSLWGRLNGPTDIVSSLVRWWVVPLTSTSTWITSFTLKKERVCSSENWNKPLQYGTQTPKHYHFKKTISVCTCCKLLALIILLLCSFLLSPNNMCQKVEAIQLLITHFPAACHFLPLHSPECFLPLR